MSSKIKQQDVTLAAQLRRYAKNTRILLVEDDIKQRESTLDALKLASFQEIGIAENGQIALAKQLKSKYDLILTDINMPIKNGIELIKTLREQGDEVRVIIMTAHNESEYYNELINYGIDGFLPKPFSLMLFLFTLSRACKSIYDSKEIEELKKEIISEQNRAIAYSYAIENDLQIDYQKMTAMRKSYAVVSAKEFIENYPTDLTNFGDKLEKLDEQLDLHIDRLFSDKDIKAKNLVAEAFRQYGELINPIHEFANLAVAFNNFAEFLSKTENFDNIDLCKDMLFAMVSELRTWRNAIFVNKDTDNIHYLDASIINDLITVEATIQNNNINNSMIEFFKILLTDIAY